MYDSLLAVLAAVSALSAMIVLLGPGHHCLIFNKYQSTFLNTRRRSSRVLESTAATTQRRRRLGIT